MDYDYYPDVDQWCKKLYYINQDWFRHRSKLSEEELQKLFEVFLKIDEDLAEIRQVLRSKEGTTVASNAKDQKNTFGYSSAT